MLAKAEKKANRYYFSVEHAVDACAFMEQLPHVEEYEGLLVFQPWQCLMFCAVFGFRRWSDDKRLVEDVYIEIPRKQGKSILCAGATLFVASCEGVSRPLIYIAAATQEQAEKVLGPAQQILELEPDLTRHFAFTKRKGVIECGASRGMIQTISSVGEHQDGHNPHMAVLEELHAQKADVYEVIRSAIGARRNPLLWKMGTAGRYASGIGYEQRQRAINLLEGTVKADNQFALIYTIDPDDKDQIYDERVQRKANPGYGISVQPDYLKNFAQEAKDTPARRGEYQRTVLNIWSNAGHRLIEPDAWDACLAKSLRLRDFRGARAWIGVDLAKRIDMAAVGVIVEIGEIIAGFGLFYIPEASPYLKRPDLYGLYNGWIDEGYLTTTPGGSTHIPTIRDDVVDLCDFLDVQAVACDPWQANQLAAELEEGGIPATAYRNNTQYLSDATYELLARIQSQTFVHNGNPILRWNAMNVEGNERNDTIFPRKPAENADEKIDGIVSIIMANGCRLNIRPEEGLKENPYETRTFMRESYGD